MNNESKERVEVILAEFRKLRPKREVIGWVLTAVLLTSFNFYFRENYPSYDSFNLLLILFGSYMVGSSIRIHKRMDLLQELIESRSSQSET
jgi:hypothetical protein